MPNTVWAAVLSPFLYLVSRTKVKFVPEQDLFLLEQGVRSIWVARRSRMAQYTSGIEARFLLLEREYGIARHKLTDGHFGIDIGANIGEVGMILEEKGLRVFAFEPDPVEFKALSLNLSHNSQCFQVALWSKTERKALYHQNESGDTSLIEAGGSGEFSFVETKTLDDALGRAIARKSEFAIMKLEAEGAEPEILAGAPKTLAAVHWLTVDAGPERGPEKISTLPAISTRLLKLGFIFESVQYPRLTAQFKSEKPGIN